MAALAQFGQNLFGRTAVCVGYPRIQTPQAWGEAQAVAKGLDPSPDINRPGHIRRLLDFFGSGHGGRAHIGWRTHAFGVRARWDEHHD